MKIVSTFAVVEESLYSVLFDTDLNTVDDDGAVISQEQLHEFRRLFDFWNDPIRLRAFFEEHEEDLKDDYWEGITIDEAIEKTRKEAKELEAILLEYAEAGKTIRLKNLSMLFKPLSDGKIEKEFEKDKVKVDGKKKWIRLYAIRIDANLFVVCGGAIKLRKTLNDRTYLLKELEKLEITRDALLDEDSDVLDFVEL
ncbi:MAG: hypothetical protein DCF13_01460 [Flavobacteriaceae bacterium]|nr:MAG: hypothetical protein DCF13_01460 [Flavobacteriaceae bacterium]